MAMTYYHQQVLKIKELICPDDFLCDKVVEAKKFIDANYYTKISLDDIAAKACISKFHFIRMFKKFFGITPNQYLVKVRLENAKELLKNGATVSTACFSVGFDSTTTFAGLFKKMTGATPSAVNKNATNHSAIPLIVYFL
jgi:AraC-like DNA-binding protein